MTFKLQPALKTNIKSLMDEILFFLHAITLDGKPKGLENHIRCELSKRETPIIREVSCLRNKKAMHLSYSLLLMQIIAEKLDKYHIVDMKQFLTIKYMNLEVIIKEKSIDGLISLYAHNIDVAMKKLLAIDTPELTELRKIYNNYIQQSHDKD